MATAAEIQTAYKAIYRTDLNATVAQAIAASGISLDAYIAQQLPQVASTTQAAVAIASFITGTVPTSARVDALKVEADKQVASYTALGVGNPALGAYEAFGRSFATDAETTAGFNTKYGALSTADFIGVVYAQVYGTQPSAAAANLTAQINYFTNLYTTNGVANAALAAKGAVLGQIVGYAFTSSASANSALDNQVQTFLTAAATGSTTGYGKALPAVVDPGTVGVTITLPQGGTATPTAADPAFKTTANDDTVNVTFTGLAADAAARNATKVDAGAGNDTLKITLAVPEAGTDTTYTPDVGAIANVENLFLKVADGAAGDDTTVDLVNVSGLKQVWLDTGSTEASNAVTTFKNFSSDVTLGLKAVATNLTVDYTGSSATTATVVADGLYTGQVIFSDATVKTVNISTVGTANRAGFADNDIETVAVTGKGSFTIQDVGTGLKSFDASGVTGSVTASFAGEGFTNKATFTLGASSDTIELDVLKAHTVNVGAGNDTVDLNFVAAGPNNLSADAIATSASLLSAALVVNGLTFNNATADTLKLDNVLGRTSLTQTQLDNANSLGATDFKAALLSVAAITDANAAADSYAAFQVGADTYIYFDEGSDGLNADDALVKLTGVTLDTLKFAVDANQNVFIS